MPYVGELVRNRAGKWITWPPTHCARGHRLGPGRMLVGHVGCRAEDRGGHTVWHCLECPNTEPPVCGRPLGPNCTALTAAASSSGRLATRSSSWPEQP
jgi:hypothetical protein